MNVSCVGEISDVNFFDRNDKYTIKKNIQAPHSQFNAQKFTALAEDYGILYGSSMQPTYFEGNTAIEKKITFDYVIHEGELIRYTNVATKNCQPPQNPEGIVVATTPMIHRVSAVYGDTLVVEGDNVNGFDLIKRCQVTHIVIGILFT